jgi:catalase
MQKELFNTEDHKNWRGVTHKWGKNWGNWGILKRTIGEIFVANRKKFPQIINLYNKG